MLLVPAIDLKGGKCVRLRQGRMEDDTVFSDDPVAMAARWVQAGARRLHLVDLDGAFAGEPRNAAVIRAIAKAFPGTPIQVGGGIRAQETIQTYLDAGVSYAIIGTKAVEEPAFVSAMCGQFPGRIMVALDARDGQVAVEGWAQASDRDALELASRFQNDGVSAVIYTDISRDGMLQGVNIEATKRLAQAISLPVIASGGLKDLEDVRALCAIHHTGIMAAIIGRALYEGTIDLSEAQQLADRLCEL